METSLSKIRIFGLIATVFSTILFIWFSNICGMIGTFHWHLFYRNIYILLCAFFAIQIVSMLLHFFLRSKVNSTLLCIISVLNILIWSGWFITLKALTSIPIDNSGLNIFSQKEEIPSNYHDSQAPVLHLAFASDPHWGSSKADADARVKILKSINSKNYDSFYILGDITEMGMLAGDYREAVSDLRTYLPDTKFRTIPGNHDSVLNGLELFDSVFMKKGEKHYYRMDKGTVHLLFINMLWDSAELSNKQCRWLEKQLQEIPQNETTIVISHCYVVSSGYYDEDAGKTWGDLKDVMDKLCPILEKYNVDLYLSGHDHFFEYLEKSDVSYLVLGAMGGALDKNLIYHSPYSKWLNNDDFGYVDMKIYDSYLEFDCITAEGKTIFTKFIETNK